MLKIYQIVELPWLRLRVPIPVYSAESNDTGRVLLGKPRILGVEIDDLPVIGYLFREPGKRDVMIPSYEDSSDLAAAALRLETNSSS